MQFAHTANLVLYIAVNYILRQTSLSFKLIQTVITADENGPMGIPVVIQRYVYRPAIQFCPWHLFSSRATEDRRIIAELPNRYKL